MVRVTANESKIRSLNTMCPRRMCLPLNRHLEASSVSVFERLQKVFGEDSSQIGEEVIKKQLETMNSLGKKFREGKPPREWQ